jgi:hypothetical protein
MTLKIRTPQTYKQTMLRFRAACLLLCFVLPLIFSSLSPSAEATALVPECCRIHGKHECVMHRQISPASNSSSGGLKTTLTQISERCPYTPLFPVTIHSLTFVGLNASRHFISNGAEDAKLIPGSKIHRAPYPESNPKRGPPVSAVIA